MSNTNTLNVPLRLNTPSRNASGVAGMWKRADSLNLGDQVLMGTWKGDCVLVKVRSMELCGDDVVLEFFGSLVGETTTSVGNEFLVVGSVA